MKLSVFLSILIPSALFSLFTSCAPVKFAKSQSFDVSSVCVGGACGGVICDPKINSNLTTFTYSGAALPSVASNCSSGSNLSYAWSVKKADSSVVTAVIPGLSGANPAGVDFTGLGQGSYYVYLVASDSGGGLNPFTSSTPLEFVVPGSGMGNSLTCDPKLNGNATSITLTTGSSNPQITANCNPNAATYIWTATKNGVSFVIGGLSGPSSTPDIKSFGAGTYRISLYATLTGSSHWQSSQPLVVTVQGAPVTDPPVLCTPRINGNLTSLSYSAASSNPLISANCAPTGVTHTWSVTKNGSAVNVPGLSGANSNPDFYSLGIGTYLIYLNATIGGYTAYNTTTPLSITVEAGAGLALTCTPRLNTTLVTVTIPTTGPNPLVTSGCVPSSAALVWAVTKNGSAVSVPGLTGASSTPDFAGLGEGTYLVYLNASASGYNGYAIPSPLTVIVSNAGLGHNVTYERQVTATDNQVDILVIVDDSSSMSVDNAKLGARLQNFVGDLQSAGLDWQMCATVTRSQDVYNNGTYFWGASRNWSGYNSSQPWVLKTGVSDPYSIFNNTMAAIGSGWAGTDDERGIKAAWWSVNYAPYNNCYRGSQSSLAMILISDEDEASVGGDSSQQYYTGELKPLEAADQPQELVNKVRQQFGNDKRFTFNSIIVKPGDAACMAAQDASGTKSHYGTKYAELSNLTGGLAASICDADYSNSLYYFKDRIVNTQGSVNLECAPIGAVTVTITPTMGAVSTQLTGNKISFNPVIPAGRTIKLEYKCP